MLFNTETLEPLYKFSIGQPGSSFTFEVAQINGIPLSLIEDAKTRLDEHKVKMDKLLSELQREKTYLERLNSEHVEAQVSAQTAKNDYLEKKTRYDEKLKTQQATIERDNKYLNAGKKMLSFIDRFTVKSRKKDVNKPLIDEVIKYISVEKSKIEEVKRTVLLKSKIATPKNAPKRALKSLNDPHQRAKIVIGSTVKLIETKQTGTVENCVGDAITVVFGFIRMKVEREKLSWLK
jgi:DNA mismatch repair protein MutS2